MNREELPPEQRLLNEVLAEQSPARCSSSKEAALAAFRHARIVRRVRHFSVAAAILATVIGAVYEHNWRSGSRVGNSASKQQARSENVERVPRLTDQELIASFPSNSCFLAEVNGQQVLVFVDPSLEEKFVSRSGKPLPQHRF